MKGGCMKLRGCIDDDFSNYKESSMFLITPECDFKCCREAGNNICQNMSIINEPIVDIDDDDIIKRYLDNPITKAVVFGGLEPLYGDYFEDVYWFIHKLRWDYDCYDPVIIYTGYNPEEKIDEIIRLSKFANVIVKFGRFIPDQPSHFDKILGVELASPNQYAAEL